MPWSKDQLLALANERAATLGLPAISESVFESWIDADLFKGADPHGVRRGVNPDWVYPDEVKETVEAILRLKSQGATRTAQLLVCLRAFGKRPPLVAVREAMKSELSRIVRRQERGPPWWKFHYGDRNSEEERAKRSLQLPGLDADLAATVFALHPYESLEALSRAYWGTEQSDCSLFPGLEEMLNGITENRGEYTFPLNIAGAIGPPGESANCGYEILDKISDDDLESAQALICSCLAGLALADAFFGLYPSYVEGTTALAFRKVTNSFVRPDWIVPSMTLFTISAYNQRQSRESA